MHTLILTEGQVKEGLEMGVLVKDQDDNLIFQGFRVLPPRYAPMPQTIDAFYHIMDRDQKLLLQQAKEIGDLKAKLNNLRQKWESRK